jgi:hypothetical protein
MTTMDQRYALSETLTAIQRENLVAATWSEVLAVRTFTCYDRLDSHISALEAVERQPELSGSRVRHI